MIVWSTRIIRNSFFGLYIKYRSTGRTGIGLIEFQIEFHFIIVYGNFNKYDMKSSPTWLRWFWNITFKSCTNSISALPEWLYWLNSPPFSFDSKLNLAYKRWLMILFNLKSKWMQHCLLFKLFRNRRMHEIISVFGLCPKNGCTH